MSIDLNVFADDNFDPIVWINQVCQQRLKSEEKKRASATGNEKPCDENLEAYLSEVEMRLQLAAEEIETSLHRATNQAMRRLPTAVKEVQRVQIEVQSLRRQVGEMAAWAQHDSKEANQTAAPLIAKQTARAGVTAAHANLSRTSELSGLLIKAEKYLKGNKLDLVAEVLQEMHRAFELLGEVPDTLKDCNKKLVRIEKQLQDVCEPILKKAFEALNVVNLKSSAYLDTSSTFSVDELEVQRSAYLLTSIGKSDLIANLYDKHVDDIWRSIMKESDLMELVKERARYDFPQYVCTRKQLEKYLVDITSVLPVFITAIREESQWLSRVISSSSSSSFTSSVSASDAPDGKTVVASSLALPNYPSPTFAATAQGGEFSPQHLLWSSCATSAPFSPSLLVSTPPSLLSFHSRSVADVADNLRTVLVMKIVSSVNVAAEIALSAILSVEETIFSSRTSAEKEPFTRQQRRVNLRKRDDEIKLEEVIPLLLRWAKAMAVFNHDLAAFLVESLTAEAAEKIFLGLLHSQRVTPLEDVSAAFGQLTDNLLSSKLMMDLSRETKNLDPESIAMKMLESLRGASRAIEDSLDRCIDLTGGVELPCVVQTIDRLLTSYLSGLTTVVYDVRDKVKASAAAAVAAAAVENDGGIGMSKQSSQRAAKGNDYNTVSQSRASTTKSGGAEGAAASNSVAVSENATESLMAALRLVKINRQASTLLARAEVRVRRMTADHAYRLLDSVESVSVMLSRSREQGVAGTGNNDSHGNSMAITANATGIRDVDVERRDQLLLPSRKLASSSPAPLLTALAMVTIPSNTSQTTAKTVEAAEAAGRHFQALLRVLKEKWIQEKRKDVAVMVSLPVVNKGISSDISSNNKISGNDHDEESEIQSLRLLQDLERLRDRCQKTGLQGVLLNRTSVALDDFTTAVQSAVSEALLGPAQAILLGLNEWEVWICVGNSDDSEEEEEEEEDGEVEDNKLGNKEMEESQDVSGAKEISKKSLSTIGASCSIATSALGSVSLQSKGEEYWMRQQQQLQDKYPQPYVTSLGDYLFNLPQQLELLLLNDGDAEGATKNDLDFENMGGANRSTLLQAKEIAEDGIGTSYLSSAVNASERESGTRGRRDEEGGEGGTGKASTPAEGMDMAAEWLDRTVTGVAALYLRAISRIPRLSYEGGKQLAVDVSYFCDVMTALRQVPPSQLVTIKIMAGMPHALFKRRENELIKEGAIDTSMLRLLTAMRDLRSSR